MLGIDCPSNSSMNEFKCGHFAKTFLFFVALKIRPLNFSKFANGDKMKLSFEIENLSTKERSGKIQNYIPSRHRSHSLFQMDAWQSFLRRRFWNKWNSLDMQYFWRILKVERLSAVVFFIFITLLSFAWTSISFLFDSSLIILSSPPLFKKLFKIGQMIWFTNSPRTRSKNCDEGLFNSCGRSHAFCTDSKSHKMPLGALSKQS